ncbi:MAG: hypothetical protein NVS9B1_17800 [Candidatus Dormibacteraceae bacterium]
MLGPADVPLGPLLGLAHVDHERALSLALQRLSGIDFIDQNRVLLLVAPVAPIWRDRQWPAVSVYPGEYSDEVFG